VNPKAQLQRCIIQKIRYSTRFVGYKDIKQLMADLKLVYHIAFLPAANLHLLTGIFLHFITDADTVIGANTWNDPRHGAVLAKASELLSTGEPCARSAWRQHPLQVLGCWATVPIPATGRNSWKCLLPATKGRVSMWMSSLWRMAI